jgi:hypothetical protein
MESWVLYYKYSGLFGHVGANSVVKNVGVENVQINGNDSAGGLVGYLIWGEISQSYSTGTVSNHKPTQSGRPGSSGGLVGRNYSGLIKDCYSMCDVSTANGSYSFLDLLAWENLIRASYFGN